MRLTGAGAGGDRGSGAEADVEVGVAGEPVAVEGADDGPVEEDGEDEADKAEGEGAAEEGAVVRIGGGWGRVGARGAEEEAEGEEDGVEVDDAFGDEALRGEGGEGALEVADHHPPEEEEEEELAAAEPGGGDDGERAAEVDDQEGEEGDGEEGVGQVEPPLGRQAVEDRRDGMSLDPLLRVRAEVEIGDDEQHEDDGVGLAPPGRMKAEG
jgi:hypothetical protein